MLIKGAQLGRPGYARKKAFKDTFTSLHDIYAQVELLESYCKALESEVERLSNQPLTVIINVAR